MKKIRVVFGIVLVLAMVVASFVLIGCGADPEVTGITIDSSKAKVEYIIGEDFDVENLEVYATYSDNSKTRLRIDSCEISGFYTWLENPDQTITVKYKEFTATYKVKINPQPEMSDEERLRYVANNTKYFWYTFMPTGETTEVRELFVIATVDTNLLGGTHVPVSGSKEIKLKIPGMFYSVICFDDGTYKVSSPLDSYAAPKDTGTWTWTVTGQGSRQVTEFTITKDSDPDNTIIAPTKVFNH